MFTGLTADIGVLESRESGAEGARLRIRSRLAAELQPGDSISVNGVCLTASTAANGAFEADAMNETLSVTSLGDLESGGRVNLELPIRAGEGFGGHFVQGHVDGVGEVISSHEDGFARRLRIRAPSGLLRLMVERGSVAVDGVSLTISTLVDDAFEVSLIPETLERTTLDGAEPGRRVNIECDVLARYVQRLIDHHQEDE
jgi:riboflavin synthase